MQNEQLDAYIAALGERLKGLPQSQRDEEMAEVRQHLDALVLAHLQVGKSPDEAVILALQQFGKAECVGAEISNALLAERLKRKAFFIGKYCFIWLCLVGIQFVAYSSMNDKPTDFPYTLGARLTIAAIQASVGLCGQFLVRSISKKRKSLRA